MLFSPVLQPTAATGATAPDCTAAADEPIAAAALAEVCGRDVEVLSGRSEWNTLVAQPDGTMRLDTSARATRTQRDGAWVEVDNTVVRRGTGLEVAAPVNPMRFSDGSDDGPLATIEREGHALSLDLPFDLPEPTVDGHQVTYTDVLPDVDLVLTVNEDATGFSEVLRVGSQEAASHPQLAQLTFPFHVSAGLEVQATDGGFVASDEAGEPVFTSPAPTMWDSRTAAEHAVLQTPQARLLTFDSLMDPAGADPHGGGDGDRAVAPTGTERIEVMPTEIVDGAVTVRPDAEMIDDERTVWPVYIDPGISGSRNDWTAIRDAISPAYRFPDTEGVGMCDRATSTTCSTTFRSRIKYRFTGLETVGALDPNNIVSATFAAVGTHSYDCTPRPVNVYRTDDFTSASTWPGGNWVLQSQQVVAHKSTCSVSPVRWIEFPVTEAARAVAGANSASVALGIAAADEGSMSGWKRYRNDATLSITYNRPPGTPTQVAFTNPVESCVTGANRPYVRVSNPTIYGVLSDPDGQTVQANVDLLAVPAGTGKSQLNAGEQLLGGQQLTSPDGRTKLVMQTDGNLVMYGPNGVHWHTGTNGRGGVRVVLQGDGNVVMYTATSAVPWHTGTNGKGGNRLILQDDGNLVLYTPSDGVVWQSGTGTLTAPVLWNGRTSFRGSGAGHSITVPGLQDGKAYRVQLNGVDSDGWAGPKIACEVRVDLKAPVAPTVTPSGSGPLYNPTTPTGGVGVEGSFTFGSGGSTDIVKYRYSFVDGRALNEETPAGSPTISYAPEGPGHVTLYYQSVDRAGWTSERKEYRFRVAFPATTTWLLDETTGSQAASSGDSGTTRPLTLSTSMTRVDGPFAEFGLDAKDKALLFDGPDDTAASEAAISTDQSFSVAAIVRADAASGPRVIASHDGANASAFELGTRTCATGAGQCWSFSMTAADQSTSSSTAAVSTSAVQAGKWTLVAGVHNATDDTLRVWTCTIGDQEGDLMPQASDDVTFAGAWEAAGAFKVGAGRTETWFGAISEARLEQGIISDGSILRMCNEPAA